MLFGALAVQLNVLELLSLNDVWRLGGSIECFGTVVFE
jgi:hypothetical protein